MEEKYVYQSYSKIAKPFHGTRYCFWNSVIHFLDKLPKYSVLADVGCGNGKYARYRNDIVWIGNDTCYELLNYAKNINNDIIEANGLHLPYKDKSIDYSISIAVLHHLSTDKLRKQFINELIRITKNNILISVWAKEQPIKDKWKHLGNNDYLISWDNRDGTQTYRYYHLFTQDEVKELFEDYNFTIHYEFDNWFIEINQP